VGPSNPWSPNWQPDPTGRRLLTIRAARRGAFLAGLLYVPIAIAAAATAAADPSIETMAIAIGLPGVALLGAGLAPAALGSRVDAVVVAIALAIGAPVAAMASLVIGGWVVDSWIGNSELLASPFLRAGVLAAIRVAPLVAAGAASWVLILRRISPPLPEPPPSTPPPGSTGP
jgi:hypothetical protein